MKNLGSTLTMRIVVLTSFCFIVGVTEKATAQNVQTNPKTNVTKTQRWEYCAITNPYPASRFDSEVHIAAASIIFFASSGQRKEEIRSEISEAEIKQDALDKNNINYIRMLANQRAADDALAKAIAKLGDEGWEMVGESPIRYGSERNEIGLYFKRLKQ